MAAGEATGRGDAAAKAAGDGEGAGLANGSDGLGAAALATGVGAAAGALVGDGVAPPLQAANRPLPPAAREMFRKWRRVSCIRFAA